MSRPETPTVTAQPATRRNDTWAAFGMIGLLLGIMAGIAHTYFTGSDPHPQGLFVATIGTAVAALWVIARLFGPGR